jgi:hypothetical protein
MTVKEAYEQLKKLVEKGRGDEEIILEIVGSKSPIQIVEVDGSLKVKKNLNQGPNYVNQPQLPIS